MASTDDGRHSRDESRRTRFRRLSAAQHFKKYDDFTEFGLPVTNGRLIILIHGWKPNECVLWISTALIHLPLSPFHPQVLRSAWCDFDPESDPRGVQPPTQEIDGG